MIKIEEITATPSFSKQLENKILYSNHSNDASISYQSTYTLKYVIQGTKHYHCNHQDIKVAPNQYLILNQDQKITTAVQKGTKGLSLFLSPKLLQEIHQYHTNTNSPLTFLEVVHQKSNNQLLQLLQQTVFLYEKAPIDLQKQIDALFINISELIVQQQIQIDTNFSRLQIVKRDTQKALYQSVLKAKDYLHDHLKDNISLLQMSKDIGISKYYLHRLFTEIHGDTPINYLTTIRLEKAKHKLQYSKEGITEIAMDCGFSNSSYFSKTFKKHLGLSPTQYRNVF